MKTIRTLLTSCYKKTTDFFTPPSESLIEHSHQNVSNFFDGFGWTLGAYFMDCASLDVSWPMYLAKSFVTGATSSVFAYSTNHLLKKIRSKETPEAYQVTWDDVVGTFLTNACWQGTYDLASLIFKQQFLYLFVPVGLLSTFAYSLPLFYKYSLTSNTPSKQKFDVEEDIKTLFTNFLICGSFVATSTPTNNFFYTETGYDTKATGLNILMDMLRSGLINVVSYSAATLIIYSVLALKRSLTKKSEEQRYLLANVESNDSLRRDSFLEEGGESLSNLSLSVN